jgi:hypothetical protein
MSEQQTIIAWGLWIWLMFGGFFFSWLTKRSLKIAQDKSRHNLMIPNSNSWNPLEQIKTLKFITTFKAGANEVEEVKSVMNRLRILEIGYLLHFIPLFWFAVTFLYVEK